jgi:threonine dehydrogenase-like Zn-dependent dehydrogenase
MLLPDRNALELDDRISFGEGVLLLDTLGTSGHALRLARCWEAESALVIGAGPIGLGAVVMLKAFGVPNVYVSEIAAYRRDAAASFGGIPIDPRAEDLAHRIQDEYRYGVDLVVEAVGSWPTIQSSLDLVRPGGTINLVGEHWGRIDLERPKGAWMINDLTLIRSFYFPVTEFYENQQMILDGTLDAASIASHTFPLQDVEAAYELFGAGQALKVLVTP